MRSKKLESFSEKNPQLAPYIRRLQAYLEQLASRHIREVIPRVAAAKLSLSEADTLGLLGLFQEAGFLTPRYDLICVTTKSVVGSYRSLDDIPDEVDCQVCGEQHSADELRPEFVFEIHGLAADAAA